MKLCLFLFSISLSLIAFSQVNADQVYYLKNIKQENQDVVDINLRNPTSNPFYILRIETADHITSRIYSKQIPPKQNSPIRLKLNPKQKGQLNETVKLYVSYQEDPIVLQFKAKVQQLPKNNRQACPSFSSGGKFVLNPKSGVYEKVSAGEFQKVVFTLNTENEIVEEDSTFLKKPLEQKETLVITEKRTRLSPEERRNQPSVLEKLFGNQDTTAQNPKKTKENSIENTSFSITSEVDTLLGNEYKANHVVFLIDASTSMREEDKMELLKQTMIQLLNPLRAQDFLSIVTYSGEAKVLLQPTSGIKKEEIKQIIKAIKADGSTQAVKGIQQALKIAQSKFLAEGNNQIILATDGAFDIGIRNQRLRNKIKSNASRGIEILVLGIKNEKWTNKSLKEIAELGNGSLLHCSSKKDTQKVLEAVKKNALH